MPGVDDQRAAFGFLCERLDSNESFTKQDLKAITSWTSSTLGTYWSKQLRPFVSDIGDGRFRVSEAFRPFATWDKFRQHVTQVRRVTATDYSRTEHDNVLAFEFFMPLTNESALRGTLDALSYKENILAKLGAQDGAELQGKIPRRPQEDDDEYHDRLCSWIGKRFVGYSISHVSGRFRSEPLTTREEAAEIERRQRYLIDETTAVTRFIFPCEDEEDASRVEWFFHALFVDSIIEVVNGEDEIWMLESGMKTRLFIWRVEADESED